MIAASCLPEVAGLFGLEVFLFLALCPVSSELFLGQRFDIYSSRERPSQPRGAGNSCFPLCIKRGEQRARRGLGRAGAWCPEVSSLGRLGSPARRLQRPGFWVSREKSGWSVLGVQSAHARAALLSRAPPPAPPAPCTLRLPLPDTSPSHSLRLGTPFSAACLRPSLLGHSVPFASGMSPPAAVPWAKAGRPACCVDRGWR